MMFVLSHFGKKALMKYNILYMVTKVQLITKRIIWAKRQKMPKNTFLSITFCVFILNFDHVKSFKNIYHYNRVKHQLNIELPMLNSLKNKFYSHKHELYG